MNFSNSIKWSPSEYVNANVVAQVAGEEMLARLSWMTIDPMVVVDLGCGIGELSTRLQMTYPKAHVLAVDLTESMLSYAKQLHPASQFVCADAGILPLRDQSVDLLFANLLIPWHGNLTVLVQEARRVLKPDGVLMLSALGLDTLKEWREVWQSQDLPYLVDMHDIGDLFLQEKLADPVLDVNHCTLSYRDQARLMSELCATGMLSVSSASCYIGDVPPEADGTWSVTYEIVYGHAFAPPLCDAVSASPDGVTRVPLAHLRRQLR